MRERWPIYVFLFIAGLFFNIAATMMERQAEPKKKPVQTVHRIR